MTLGKNQRAYLTHIRSEPGQWAAPTLAEDFGVQQSSVRRSLRQLQKAGLIFPGKRPKRIGSRGQPARSWFPVEDK